MKRPASHKWAIFGYAAFIAVNGMLALQGAPDPATLFLLLLCGVQLAGAFVSPHARRHYEIGVVTLGLIALRGLYYSVLEPGYYLLRHNGNAPGWIRVGVDACGVALLFWLVSAYASGKASRAYYGFPQTKGND